MPQRPVSEYDVEKDMKELARLLLLTMCEKRLDRSDCAPRDRSCGERWGEKPRVSTQEGTKGISAGRVREDPLGRGGDLRGRIAAKFGSPETAPSIEKV